MKLTSSREVYSMAMAAGLEATNTILPSPLFTNPMLPLAGTLAIFKTIQDSNFIILKDKKQVNEADDYLTKQLTTMAILVDNST